jgi:predicted deacetylase
MKVALRDDDACYFTRPDILERVYHDVWDQVPVCLATVPFAIGYKRQGIPPEHWTSGIAFALDRNPDLVALLKESLAAGRVTIALHGYTHEDFAGGFEFQACPDPERRVSDGLRYLQQTLGTTISIFVPPHNALSKRSMRAIDSAGLHLLGSFLSFRPSLRPWDARTPANWWRIQRYRAATARRRHDRFVYPFVLRYRNHKEFGCHSLIPGTTFAELKDGFDEARARGGDFCVATHYWEVDSAMKDVLRRFLDYAGRHRETQFVTAEALFA